MQIKAGHNNISAMITQEFSLIQIKSTLPFFVLKERRLADTNMKKYQLATINITKLLANYTYLTKTFFIEPSNFSSLRL